MLSLTFSFATLLTLDLLWKYARVMFFFFSIGITTSNKTNDENSSFISESIHAMILIVIFFINNHQRNSFINNRVLISLQWCVVHTAGVTNKKNYNKLNKRKMRELCCLNRVYYVAFIDENNMIIKRQRSEKCFGVQLFSLLRNIALS